ncbi:MAG: AMMECR1 domain-containing protein [Spirochaetes bacterium]|nr:MAG: AMMECR1 domain-containing protein [Spirochaetota bacterium]
MDFTLTDEEKRLLLETARESIASKLEGRKPEFKEPTENLKVQCGAFVTLHIHGRLRGCIGHMVGVNPLMETIKELALSSAFNDPRFPPLSPHELEEIDIEISVLTPLKKISSVDEIEVGKHGIYLKKGSASGVLLPQVATEEGWDRETFLTHTCYKAGLTGNCWKDPKTEISIFSAIIFGEKE